VCFLGIAGDSVPGAFRAGGSIPVGVVIPIVPAGGVVQGDEGIPLRLRYGGLQKGDEH